MKSKFAIYSVLLAGLLLTIMLNCKKETIKTAPTVSISGVSKITSISASSGGDITADGGAEITAKGVCWSTNQGPTTSDSKTSNGSGTGSFTGSITGLTPGATYNVRAYAINSVGTGYSSQTTFTTLALAPVLTTADLSAITATTATSGGNITNDGGSSVTARGVCWSKSQNPTIADTKTTDGTGTGSFTSAITGLTPGTTYYFRAYATNSIGTGYGNQVIAITTATLSTLTTTAVSAITSTTATSGGNITSDGGAPITARGVCWSTSSNPTTANSKTTDGAGTGSFTSAISGLTPGATYYVKAYATNSIGTAYGNELTLTAAAISPVLTTGNISNITATTAVSGGNITTDGGSPVTGRGVCWSTSSNPTILNSKTTDGAGTGSFTSSITGLTHGATYYVRAYATNSIGTTYGNELTLTAAAISPVLTTGNISNITSTTAISGGNITSDGGAPIVARGVCWSTSSSPITSNSKTTDGTGTGSFTSSITGLAASTTYYVRAYATNSAGTAYGNEISVTTSKVYQLEYISGSNQSYFGGGMPLPMVFKIKNVTDNVYITSLEAEDLSLKATADIGHQDAEFNNLNNYCGNVDNRCFGGYYFIDIWHGNDYTLHITVTLTKNNQVVSTYPITENIKNNPAPTVITSSISAITSTSATVGGNVTADGGTTVYERGIYWSTSTNLEGWNGTKLQIGSGTGSFSTSLSGLSPNTLYYIRAYAINSGGTAYGTQITFITNSLQLQLPTLTTKAAASITTTSATSGGNITFDGGATVTARGVCWSTSSSPTISNNKTTDGTGTGSFTSSLAGLTASTTYYVRAYATNSVGTSYGSQVSFTTSVQIQLPTITTTAASSVSITQATSGGSISSDGGATVTARGVCWGTTSNPTIANSKTTDGTGTGGFTSSLTGLTPSTTYYVRSYATNSVGTSYGSQVSFTTSVQTQLPTLTTTAASTISTTSATSGGSISSDGGAIVSARGVCWSTSSSPTTSNNKTTDGTGTGSFTSSLTGLTANTTYYLRAYASNSAGTGYGSQVSFKTLVLTVTDIDGNVYQTVTIGTQVWMASNLKVTKYNDGTDIPLITSAIVWSNLATPGYCWYDNDAATNKDTYGALYNWFTVSTGKICPAGWHASSDQEWSTLSLYLNGCFGCNNVAGGILKETGTSHWFAPNAGATNEFGFSALPGGYRDSHGMFYDIRQYGIWWTSTVEYAGMNAKKRNAYYGNGGLGSGPQDLKDGLSVRCLKD